MQTEDLILLGIAGIALYYLFKQRQPTPPPPPTPTTAPTERTIIQRQIPGYWV